TVSWQPASRRAGENGAHFMNVPSKNAVRRSIALGRASQVVAKPGCRVGPTEGGRAMDIFATDARTADLNQLGDEIAELSAHLEAATARLLDLIREFDARGGWGNGFRSCARWLSWRVGLAPGAAREHVRVARALGTLPLLGQALARGELSYAKLRALTRVATPETEERLLAVGRAGNADDGAAASGRPGAAGRDGAPPRDRPRRSGRALPGGGPRRCRGPGGRRRARPVGARGRCARSRGNVPAPGVRRQSGGDAPRPGRP